MAEALPDDTTAVKVPADSGRPTWYATWYAHY